MKIRTQILLESRHDAWLRREAKARNCSLSAAVRQILDERFGKTHFGKDPFAQLAGSFDGSSEPVGRNADGHLYGNMPLLESSL